MKTTDNKQRLFEVMGKIDPTFKPSAQLLTEWNFDKKKGESKKEEKKEEKEEGSEKKKFNFEKKEGKEHEKVETPEEEKEEHEDKEELKEADAPAAKKIPVNMIAKVGGK
jgi:D-alanyl-D-alanine carboxypeptidase